jgi:hypothetical protein
VTPDSLTKKTPNLGWFHRYPARFPSEVLVEMYEGITGRLGRHPKNVLDPFAGTGATLAFARQFRIPSFGVELTPLGQLITRVRLDPPRDLENALEVAEKMVHLNPARAHKFPPELIMWIGEINALRLSKFIEIAGKQTDYRLRRWLTLAISSALRPSSVWLSGSIKPQVDPDRSSSEIGPHFLRAMRALKRDCEIEGGNFDVCAKLIGTDARSMNLEARSVAAVITSPPYWTMYDYFDVHRLSYLAFDWPREVESQIGRATRIDKDGIGFIPPYSMSKWYRDKFAGENTISGRSLRDYFKRMRTHLESLYRVMQSGGVAAYAVANSFRDGEVFPLAAALSNLMRSIGFRSVQIVPRQSSHRRILPAGRDINSGRFTSSKTTVEVEEMIVYARK